jgi:signal transduction histidine kinase
MEVPVILASHTSRRSSRGPLPDLRRRLRARLQRVRRPRTPGGQSPDDALVRALCHDMRGPLSCLESALRHLGAERTARGDLLAMAQAQAAHLTSMLRTAEATRGAPTEAACEGQRLRDVVATSVAASGLPRQQLTLRLGDCTGDVLVGDARLQRIMVNLLENAHRHGRGEPVELTGTYHGGWVELAVTQPGVPAAQVAGHLRRVRPPADLTGLGLWSVQRQTRELGGRVVCEDGAEAVTLRVRVPDR